MELKGRRIVVTGGAGFIGSHAVDALVREGAQVTVLDDLSTGDEAFLADSRDAIELVVGDAADPAVLDDTLAGADAVWHIAANPEVRTGETDPQAHFDSNVAMTWQVLQAARRAGVGNFVFTSTSTVYGTANIMPTPEDYGPLLPISVYGGAKLACEGLISSFCGTFGMDAQLLRFANVVGPRSNHGVTVDFVAKLGRDPDVLEILGDGTQTKSYVHVHDTVAGMVHAAKHAPAGCHAYNIGSLDSIPVTTIADTVADAMALAPEYRFTGGTRDGAGWTGDVKHMGLEVSALMALGPGWRPKHTSAEAVRDTAKWLVDQ